MTSLKQQLYNACMSYVNERIVSSELAIREVQASANEETKSSAGDKYETARSMAQLEIDKHRDQLAKSFQQKQELARISPEFKADIVKPGSVVFTSRGSFYIAISAGQLDIDHRTFFAVSPASPIAKALMGLKMNNTFTFQGEKFSITDLL